MPDSNFSENQNAEELHVCCKYWGVGQRHSVSDLRHSCFLMEEKAEM